MSESTRFFSLLPDQEVVAAPSWTLISENGMVYLRDHENRIAYMSEVLRSISGAWGENEQEAIEEGHSLVDAVVSVPNIRGQLSVTYHWQPPG